MKSVLDFVGIFISNILRYNFNFFWSQCKCGDSYWSNSVLITEYKESQTLGTTYIELLYFCTVVKFDVFAIFSIPHSDNPSGFNETEYMF